MKIAVASLDGATVAASLQNAAGVLIFEVIGNTVEYVDRRRTSDGWNRAASLIHIDAGGGTSNPAAGAAAIADEGVPADLLREMLDCEVVVAGGFSATEQAALRRLGILSLPAFTGDAAEAAVRFVVSGSPPQEGVLCGHCPKRQTDS